MPLKYYAESRGEPVSVPCPASGVELETFIPWTLVKRGAKTEVITPIDTPKAFREEAEAERQRRKAEQHSPVVRALGLAYYWQSLIEAGKFDSFAAIAAAEGTSKGHVSRLMQLCRLSPERVQGLIRSPHSVRLEKITRQEVPVCWERQREGIE
jgi:hypothetical protein